MGKHLIVYVDGFNLYHGIHDVFGRKKLWLDLVALSRSLRPNSDLLRVNYFTATVLDDPIGASHQATYIKALTSYNPGLVNVISGRYQRKSIRCYSCGNVRNSYEEKETDINIAITLVADALRNEDADRLIISADSDLVPAVKAIKLHAPSVFVAAAFPPNRYSTQLKALMPASFQINKAKISGAQLPDRVQNLETGNLLERPVYWK